MSREHQTITITCTLPSGGDVADVWAAMALAGSLGKHMQYVAGEHRLHGEVAAVLLSKALQLRHCCTGCCLPHSCWALGLLL